MKLVYYTFLMLLMAAACTTKQEHAGQTTTLTAIDNASVPNAPQPISDRLIQLGLTSDSHWRGLSLGDDFDTVKKIEKDAPFEQDVRHAGYAIDFPNLESMDVLYEQQHETISAITADLYLNNRSAVNAYKKELSEYFTNRYGMATVVNGNPVWNGPVNEQFRLIDVSKGKDFGLKVSITSFSGATASAK